MNKPRIDIKACGEILRLAGPLILSMTGLFLMQIMDGLFLSWYSSEAIAAAGPAGMAAYLPSSLFGGAVAYASTLVAQYVGAGRRNRIGAVVWQGIYFALAAGVAVACLTPFAAAIFRLVGHAPQVQEYERQYFQILCLGTPVSLLAMAVPAFFIGRGDTLTPTIAQCIGLAVNGVLDYLLIFGKFGFPAWGMGGAAIATVIAQAVTAGILGVQFLAGRAGRDHAAWTSRGLDADLMRRLLRFGLPSGFRFAIEVFSWLLFLLFVGRLGTTPLAATSIAWRINGAAFFPIIGLSEAIRTLVGQAQGRRDPDLSAHVTGQGILLAEAWMCFAAFVFIAFPHALYGVFESADAAAGFDEIRRLGVVLLRFVALYSLLDAFNIVFMGSLQAAGDTQWTLRVSVTLHIGFLAALFAADRWLPSLTLEWSIATAFVMLQALVWFARFRAGAWRDIRVIEPDPIAP